MAWSPRLHSAFTGPARWSSRAYRSQSAETGSAHFATTDTYLQILPAAATGEGKWLHPSGSILGAVPTLSPAVGDEAEPAPVMAGGNSTQPRALRLRRSTRRQLRTGSQGQAHRDWASRRLAHSAPNCLMELHSPPTNGINLLMLLPTVTQQPRLHAPPSS